MSVPAVSPDLPPWTWRAMLALLGRVPQGALSRGFGRVADLPLPRGARRPILGAFARAVGIDVSEAELPIEAYGSLDEFFVRRLRPGVREWPNDPATAGSPVDGSVGQLGTVEDGRLLQAKGRWYSAAGLLDDAEAAGRFAGGAFITLYLSPRDYHRIHAPTGGRVRSARYVPGALLPVNAAAVAHVPDLFARNERLICYVDGPLGLLAVVAVGAYNVARISTAFDATWAGRERGVTNRRGARAESTTYSPPVPVSRGDELMAFHLGSTVVLLFQPTRARLEPDLQPGARIRLGNPIARAA